LAIKHICNPIFITSFLKPTETLLNYLSSNWRFSYQSLLGGVIVVVKFAGNAIKKTYAFFYGAYPESFEAFTRPAASILAGATIGWLIVTGVSTVLVGGLTALEDQVKKDGKKGVLTCLWEGASMPTKVIFSLFGSKDKKGGNATQPESKGARAEKADSVKNNARSFAALVPERRVFEKLAFEIRTRSLAGSG
jgi:hypothetical protein